MSLYTDLGLTPEATGPEIKDAFRRLARRTHPDRAGGNKEEFQKVNKAYSILSVPEKRARYDQTGETNQPEAEDADAMVRRELIAMFLQIAMNNEPDSVDYRTSIEQMIRKNKDGMKEQEQNARKTLVRLDKARKRLAKKKTKTPDFLLLGLEAQVENIKQGLARTEEVKKLFERMLEMLKTEYDSRPVYTPAFTATASTAFWGNGR